MSEDNKLSVLVQESGLELNDAETIKQSYLPYFQQIAEVKEAAKRINYDAPTDFDEEYAKQLRLKLVKVRTGSDEIRANRKKIHTLRANVEQSAWNLIRDTCAIDEERFLQIEKARERKAALEREVRKKERLDRVAPFFPEGFNIDGLDLINMPDETFEIVVTGLIKQHNNKKAAEAKLELERQEREKKAAEEREAQRIENERLKKEADEREAAANEERERIKEQLAEADRILNEQKERARAEQARIDREFEEERRKVAAERRAEQLEFEKGQEAAAKAMQEVEDLKAAEARRIKDESERIAKVQREKIAEEKRLAKAPDKDKLKAWIQTLTIGPLPMLKSFEANEAEHKIQSQFEKLKDWATKEIDSI